MEHVPYFLAVDLGATSGRTILGSIVDGRLQQRELTRFPNNIIAGICGFEKKGCFTAPEGSEEPVEGKVDF